MEGFNASCGALMNNVNFLDVQSRNPGVALQLFGCGQRCFEEGFDRLTYFLDKGGNSVERTVLYVQC